MPSQKPNRPGIPEQVDPGKQPEPNASTSRGPLLPSPRAAASLDSEFPDHRPVHQQVSAGEPPTLRGEREEVLIADVRGNVAPAQMVGRKLDALLRSTGFGSFGQASDQGCDRPAGGRRSSQAFEG
jgi:hypothetical protein